MKSVVLVTIDALKNVLVGSEYGGSASATPELDDWFEGGARFHRVFAASFPTQFAMPGLILGDLPLDDGGYHNGIVGRGTTLAEKFAARGYRTLGVTTDYHTSGCYGYARGFDEFCDLHDPAWHANGIKRNDVDFLTGRGPALGIPPDVVNELIFAKLAKYLPFIVSFCERRAEEISSSERASIQIDNWNFARLLEIARAELESFERDPRAHVQRVLSGRSEWFSRLPQMRIGPHYPDADYVLDRAAELVSTSAGKPFFLWVHLTDVHGTLTEDLTGLRPWDATDEDLRRDPRLGRPFGRYPQRYPGQGERSDWRVVRYADRQIASFFRRLQAECRPGELITAISADHGDHRAERYGYGATDGISDHLNFFDELMHIPLLIKGAGQGSFDNLLSILDVGKLLLSLSSESNLESCARSLQRRFVISEHACPGTCIIPYKPLKIAVRSDRAKVVWFDPPDSRFGPARVVQAYDLVADPLEKNNHVDRPDELGKLDWLVHTARARAHKIRTQEPPRL